MKYILVFLLIPCYYIGLQAQIDPVDSISIQKEIQSHSKKPYSKGLYLIHQRLAKQSLAINYQRGEALSNLWMGNYAVQIGQLEDAVSHYQKLTSIGEEIKDSVLLAKGYVSLAIANSELLNLDKCIEQFELSIQLSKHNNDSKLLATGLDGLGVAYAKKEEYDEAVKYLKQGKQMMEKIDNKPGVQNAIYNISYVYLLQKKPLAAKPFVVEYLDFAKTHQDSFNIAFGYSIMGKTFRGLKQYNKALMYNDSALYLINLLELNSLKHLVYLEISKLYQEKNENKKALEFHQEYHIANQEFINENTKKNIAELEVKYETEKKEKELIASQKEVTELEQLAQIRQQNIWLILAGLLSTIITAFFIFSKLKSNARQKDIQEKLIRSELKNKDLEAQQLQVQLDNKQSDLTNLALDIGRKNKFSNTLVNRLENLQKVKPDQWKPELREVTSFVVNHLQINEDLALLQKNVDKVNQEFYQKIESRFTGLTANEKYLAGLIRLNLSNKEIASIKGISTGSAKMGRHRLRKKLELSAETDIVTFLQGV